MNKEIHIRQRELTVDEIRKQHFQNLRVVDLCCGTGKVTCDLLALSNVGQVVAIDINERALEMMSKRLLDHPEKQKLTALRLDVMADPDLFALGRFDIVICLDALHHVWDLPQALSRISRLLRHDGILIGNYLVAENIPSHVMAKKGRCNYLKDLFLAKFFIALGFIDWFWEFAGRLGIVRLSWLSKANLLSILNEDYEVLHSTDNDYFWFVAKKRE